MKKLIPLLLLLSFGTKAQTSPANDVVTNEDGARFEYEINNDEKKSKVFVSLYGIIQHNGQTIDDKLIATSEVKKYKKDSPNSLEFIKSELLKQLISDSQGLIQYKYNTWIQSDKVIERNTKNHLPGQKSKAEYMNERNEK